MKIIGKLFFISLFAWGLLIVESLADEIILKNGDRLGIEESDQKYMLLMGYDK